MPRSKVHWRAIPIGIVIALGLGVSANAHAANASDESQFVSEVIESALADVPLSAELRSVAIAAVEPAGVAAAAPAPAPALQPLPSPAAAPEATAGVARPPAAADRPEARSPVAAKPAVQRRYHLDQAQYRAAPDPPPATSEPTPQTVAQTALPSPRTEEPTTPASSDGCTLQRAAGGLRLADGCAGVVTMSANSIVEFVGRYRTLLSWYQSSPLPGFANGFEVMAFSAMTEPPATGMDVIPLPETSLDLIPGLEELVPEPGATRNGLPLSTELEPLPVRPDPPPAAHTAAPGRAPTARDQAPPAASWRAPPVAAQTAPPRARSSQPPRASDTPRKPQTRVPLPERPRPGTPGVGGASGSAGSAGGSPVGTGAVLASLLFAFGLAMLDLLRRLRLELARPRSEHVDSFPERPG